MDIGAIFRQNEMNRVSDITADELQRFINKLDDWAELNVWLSNIAIPFFKVTLRHPDHTGATHLFYQLKDDEIAELGDIGKAFHNERPIVMGITLTNVKTTILIGTLKDESGPAGYIMHSDVDEKHWDTLLVSLVALFSYINRILLTQPPKKGRTRIEKVHETLLNGQVISHPQKVTFYQLPDPEQINHRKIAAYQREWHCPAWGVRGHYRHYKSGKVVFIKSYVKGKDKSKYEGREYDIGLVTEGGRICY